MDTGEKNRSIRVGSIRAGSIRTGSASIWTRGDDVFSRSSRDEDDEEALKWASLEKLPTYNRLRKGILTITEGPPREVDIENLSYQERKNLIERLVRVAEEDNEKFLLKLRDRIDQYEQQPPPPFPLLDLNASDSG